MPLVLTKLPFGSNLGTRQYGEIIKSLPRIDAYNLTAPPEGTLTPDEVEVWDIPNNTRNIAGVFKKDVEIIVFAHDYPDRKVNLEERKTRIINELSAMIPANITFSVWILVMPTAWGEAIGTALSR